MRVGLVIYGELEFTSGGFMYDRRVVEFLRERGNEVEIISLPWRSYPQHLSDNLSTGLLKQLNDLAIDILLQDELNHASLFWINRKLKQKRRLPIVSIVHHLRSKEEHPRFLLWLYRWVERAYLNSVDATICVSATTQQDVMSLAGNDKPSVVCPPAGNRWQSLPDEAEVSARSGHSGALNLLFLGNVIPRKGLHILLEAIARTPPEMCGLRVAGNFDLDKVYVQKLRRLIQRHGLEKRVDFLGAVSAEEVESELRRADVMVVPSGYEGFGIVYLEGLGFGLPGIAGRAGAAGEIIKEGVTGFLVDAKNPEELAGRIQELATDRDLLKRMSLSALKAYPAFADWNTSMSQVNKFLTEIVGNAIIFKTKRSKKS